MTLGGAIWLWAAAVLLAAGGLTLLFLLHGRWDIGLGILGAGVGLLLGVRWLARVLGASDGG